MLCAYMPGQCVPMMLMPTGISRYWFESHWCRLVNTLEGNPLRDNAEARRISEFNCCDNHGILQ